ncbi:hypothetical protein ACFYWY_35660 [Streptomyces sp. NPDC002870]|uniref:hypothetical protein n=1 Tax=Streptomyces sp. NPDC002870 TaxID=3364666 RepID=UPI0036B681C9
MTSPTYHDDALLIAGELRIPVRAQLEVFGTRTSPQWRGTLDGVPTAMIYDLKDSPEIRLRMPDEQERYVHLREAAHDHEAEFTSVPISGDGTPPF